RRGSIAGRPPGGVWGGALPRAGLGGRGLGVFPRGGVHGVVAAGLLGGGPFTPPPPRGPREGRPLGPGARGGRGALTRLASAALGAGGAFLLVPLLVALGEPVLLAVGLGQAIQVPIAAVASVANVAAGRVDWAAGWILAAALSVGIAIGTPLAHGLSQRA